MRNSQILLVVSLIIIMGSYSSCSNDDYLRNENFEISITEQHQIIIEDRSLEVAFEFSPKFKVFMRDDDPKMALRPANISKVPYNVVTWLTVPGEDLDILDEVKRDESQQGDGFDARILDAGVSKRTANLFQNGESMDLVPIRVERRDSAVVFYYDDEGRSFSFRSWLSLPDNGYPKLSFEFVPEKDAFYSVGYIGAPSYELNNVKEIWQPMIWQEKRFPDQSYMTLAYRCPLPSTLVQYNDHTLGVVADPSEYAFDLLPLADNSRFGVAVRNEHGQAQPMLFAPVMGGFGSEMKANKSFKFSMQLYLEPKDMLSAYKKMAQDVYGFRDYRSNGPHQLNRTLDNVVQYGMSHWSYFIDSLKGCAYSTDVPGAVKNVSSLNPLEMALIMDNQEIYDERAYPIIEYLLSREKFLFSLDREQKIQNPSRAMEGPAAPVSELAALYDISNRQSPAFLKLAQQEYEQSRIRNLDKKERGDTWQNVLALYRASGKQEYLERAMAGAEKYIENRVLQKATDFEDSLAQLFFWTGFVPDYIGLFQLYEASGHQKFLDAAHQAALQYTQFIWFSPEIPDKEILVNKGGEAPLYWYLKSKGHIPMTAAEESVPAWRLSSIGLTPESSGTCQGHRAIFMAHHAPWMYRIGYEAKDQFLIDVARSAIVGRYSNFPGYHINTARTTIYEKPDYPLRPFKELSVNSFHFNHIWPLASVLVDYLVTDAYVRSKGAIDFPSEFIEGYAYLQSKFYGHRAGAFYGEEAWLWMPQKVLEVSSDEINFLTARGDNTFFVAFSNQSDESIDFTFQLSKELTGYAKVNSVRIRNNNEEVTNGKLEDGSMQLRISPNGVVAIAVDDIQIKPKFQQRMTQREKESVEALSLMEIKDPKAKAMILDLGQGLKTAYIYLEEDDDVFSKVTINYSVDGGENLKMEDAQYPYEFTINLGDQSVLDFSLVGVKPGGVRVKSEEVSLGS